MFAKAFSIYYLKITNKLIIHTTFNIIIAANLINFIAIKKPTVTNKVLTTIAITNIILFAPHSTISMRPKIVA